MSVENDPSSAYWAENKGPVLMKMAIAMTVLATTSIVLRFWSRLLSEGNKKIWWDDWLALAAWMCCMCNTAFSYQSISMGLGHHYLDNPSPSTIVAFMKIFYVDQIVFDCGLALAKFSALTFYLRMFNLRRARPRFKISYCVTFTFVVVFIVFKLPCQIFLCYPPRKYWHPEVPGRCENVYTNFGLLIAGLALDVVTDFMILIIPMPIISGLQIPPKRKIRLFVAFFCGYLAPIVSIGRLVAYTLAMPHLDDPDISWYQIPAFSAAMAEIGIVVFSISVPTWLALSQRVRKGASPDSSRSRDMTTSYSNQCKTNSRTRRLFGFLIDKPRSSAPHAANNTRDTGGGNVSQIATRDSKRTGTDARIVQVQEPKPGYIYRDDSFGISLASFQDGGYLETGTQGLPSEGRGVRTTITAGEAAR